jgi:hypothetical protein
MSCCACQLPTTGAMDLWTLPGLPSCIGIGMATFQRRTPNRPQPQSEGNESPGRFNFRQPSVCSIVKR